MKIIGAILLLILVCGGFAREGRVIRMEQLYEDNEEFREYVDKYAQHREITVERALRHKIVAIVAKEKFDYEL